jgi:hypothetical protein
MKRNIVYGIFSISFIFYNCNNVIQKDIPETQKDKTPKVSLLCLKDSDTLYLKIINHSSDTIYIPKEYDGDCTNNDDTLHLETNNKPQYNTTYYYKYTRVFPFEFYTTKQIPGYKPDTIEQYKKQTYFFNQFRVQPILPILPDSALNITIKFDVPKYATIVKAVFYTKPFLNKDLLDKVAYTLEDFTKFDTQNAKYVTSPILIRYR